MRIHKIIRKTKAEGPGTRFSVWVQGCSHRCQGCFAVDTWDFKKGTQLSAKQLVSEFMQELDSVDGVTLLGGEPFEQADDVACFVRTVHDSGKSVIVFTGYDYDELVGSDDPAVSLILENTDILIDGKFDKNLVDYSRPLVGSSNQSIRFLSDRIPEKEFYSYQNRFEVRYDKKGNIQVNGMGDVRKLKETLGGNNVRF